MKHVFILFLMAYYLPLASQSNIPKEDVMAKWKYFSKYSPDQREIICNNWTQFFKGDILTDLNPSLNAYPIKLDSYGSFYPRKEILTNIEEDDFTYKNRNEVDMFKFSLYEMTLINEKKIRDASRNLSDAEGRLVYNELINDLEKDESKNVNYTTESIDTFYKKWDNYHFKYEMLNLKNKIAEGHYARIIFFIHGYNVPYSLANIQTIELANIIESIQKKGNSPLEKILYVPIFWPSNAQKECGLTSEEVFNTEDAKGLLNGGANNGFRFLYYSNRAYYAGITLRKILNELKDVKVKFNIYSHSLGGIVATTALINTYSKLQSDYVGFMKNYDPKNPNNKQILEQLQKDEPVTYDIFTGLRDTPLPNQHISVFLSAPAMPGVSTFTDMAKPSLNVKYYCTIDTEDRMLTKKAVVIFGMKILDASMFNATTLGCDFKGEISKTNAVFKEKNGNTNNFTSLKASNKNDHDILTYIQQPNYINLITSFLNE